MRLEALEIAVQKMADERDFSSTFDDFIAPQPYQSTEESAYTSLRRGQTVLHQKFGKGKVLTTSGKGGEERAEINFDKAGLKTMALRYAKLELLPD